MCAAALALSPYLLLRGRSRTIAPQRFLIIPHLTRVGDLVVSTAVFSAIKNARPDAHISVLVSRKAEGIIAANPRIELIYYEDYKYRLFGLARALRGGKFDAVLILSGTALCSALALFSLAPLRIKLVRQPRPPLEALTDWLCNERLLYRKGENLERFYASMLERAHIRAPGVRELFTTQAGERKAQQLLAPHLGKELIGVALSAGNRIKEWGDGKFEELLHNLLARENRVAVLLAGPGEEERAEALRQKLGQRALVAKGFSLEELPSLMQRLNLFIIADTGPMHVAATLRIPTVNIIGPVMQGELTPEGPHVRVVAPHGVEPTIFAFHPAGDPRESRRAADAISVARVLSAVEELI